VTPVHRRDVGVEVPHTGNSGHSDGAVDIADPGPVDVDVNKGSGEVTCVLGPGAFDIGDNVGVMGSGFLDGGDDGCMAVAVPGSDGSFDDGTPETFGGRRGPGDANDVLVGLGTSSWQSGVPRLGADTVDVGVGDPNGVVSTGAGTSLRTGESGMDSLSPGSLGADMSLRWREGTLTPLSFCSLMEPYDDVHGDADPGIVMESGLADNGDDIGQCGVDPGPGETFDYGWFNGVNGQCGDDPGPGVVEFKCLSIPPRHVDGQGDPGPDMAVDYGRSNDVMGNRDDNWARPDVESSGQTLETGVGVQPRNYICGPTGVGARPCSYTYGHTGDYGGGEGPRSYICGPTDGHEDGRLDEGRPNPKEEDAGHSRGDDLAIAGDPQSILRRKDRPRRTVKPPVRFRDYVL